MVDLFDLSEAPGTTETLSFVIITRPSMRSLFGGPSLSPVASYCEISYIVSSSLFFLFFLTFVLLVVQVIRSPPVLSAFFSVNSCLTYFVSSKCWKMRYEYDRILFIWNSFVRMRFYLEYLNCISFIRMKFYLPSVADCWDYNWISIIQTLISSNYTNA